MFWLNKLTTSLSNKFGRHADSTVTSEPPPTANLNESQSGLQTPASEYTSYNALSRSGMSVIDGPRHNRNRYYGSIAVMFVAGSGSDFLAKLVYQFLPTDIEMYVYLWMAWLITICAFLICIFAIFNGLESFEKLNWYYFIRICVPALCDVFVSGGRYVALVFLPASIVSVLKNGLQLVFLAIIRAMLSQYITKWQIAGISILWIGLVLCTLEDVLQIDNPTTFWGLLLMFFVGLIGALRNAIEEFLLKKEGFHPDFILGFEGIISFTTMIIIGIIFLFTTIPTNEFGELPSEIVSFFEMYPGSIICVVIFMIVLVTKKSMQFHVTKMSSAMTRKLFQQFYPIGVWFMVLVAYYAIDPKFGEPWDQYQYIRIFGIFLVLLGTFVYLKPEYFYRFDCTRGKGSFGKSPE